MNLIDPILAELNHEAATTRRLLERVPEDQLAWQPHEKSMSLARLATHVAEIPGWVKIIIGQDELVLDDSYTPPLAGSVAELLDILEQGVTAASETLEGQTNEHLMGAWRLKRGDQVVMEMPRIAVIRSVILNHMIHHRGQLSVYLRLHNVPLPSIYGPSADEGF